MKHKKLAVLVLHVYLKQGNIHTIVFETALKICFKDTLLGRNAIILSLNLFYCRVAGMNTIRLSK